MKVRTLCMVAFTAIICISCSNSKKAKENTGKNNSNALETTTDSKVTACQHASKIYWKGSKPTGSHTGIVKIKSGNYFVEGNALVGGEFVVDMNSIINIDLENEDMNTKLVQHLKSPDFFYVDSFPEGKFIITEVKKISHDKFTHEINGDLTLKGITNPISFKAVVKVNKGVVNATSEEFVINRTLWGVNFKSKSIFRELKDKFIDDEFTIKIEAYSM